jgi:hypothetical protein
MSNRSIGSPDNGLHRDSDSDSNMPAKRRSFNRGESSPDRGLSEDGSLNQCVGSSELALVRYEGGGEEVNDAERLARRVAEVCIYGLCVLYLWFLCVCVCVCLCLCVCVCLCLCRFIGGEDVSDAERLARRVAEVCIYGLCVLYLWFLCLCLCVCLCRFIGVEDVSDAERLARSSAEVCICCLCVCACMCVLM